MSANSRVRVYIACSLDGFIAGPDNDLSWLPQNEVAPEDTSPGCVEYKDFMAQIGAILMGRNTYDVAQGFEGEWPYGNTPVLVATRRDLTPKAGTVLPVSGSIEQLVAQARDHAGDQDIYLDGGELIRQALAANLISELIVTVVPAILGRGIALFAGLEERQAMEFTGHSKYGSMLQLHMRPRA